MAGNQFGLRSLIFCAHFGGIAARAFAFDPGDVLNKDRFGTKRLDLFLGGRAHVSGRNLRAQPPRGGDRLKASNADAHNERLGGAHRARRRHHHRESSAIGIGRLDHRFIAREVGLAGQDVHALRAGDARHEFHCEGFKPGLGIFIDPLALTERIQSRDDPRPGIRALQRFNFRPLHAEHDIRALDSILDHFRAGSDEFGVADRRALTRSSCDRNACAQRDELLHRFRAGRDPGFPGRGLFQDGYPHWQRGLIRDHVDGEDRHQRGHD